MISSPKVFDRARSILQLVQSPGTKMFGSDCTRSSIVSAMIFSHASAVKCNPPMTSLSGIGSKGSLAWVNTFMTPACEQAESTIIPFLPTWTAAKRSSTSKGSGAHSVPSSLRWTCPGTWNGVGTALLEDLFRIARKRDIRKIVLYTTNDDTDALRLYPRHGFEVSQWRTGAFCEVFKLHGMNLRRPVFGDLGIEVRDVVRALDACHRLRLLRLAAGRKAAGSELVSSLEALLRESDVASVHAPLTEETRFAVDAAALAQVKPSAFPINPSGDPTVDEATLIET